MSFVPSSFELRREFQATGSFRELMALAESGDVVALFDPNDEDLQERCGSRSLHVSHSNSYVAIGADTESKDQQHLWLYHYDGTLVADLGTQSVTGYMPFADKGILAWNAYEGSSIQVGDTLTLIRVNGSREVIFTGGCDRFETDSCGNLYIIQDRSIVRVSVTEQEVRLKEYFRDHAMFSESAFSKEPDHIISGNSLWINDWKNNFLRVGPDGAITTIPASLLTNGMKHWYAQDEWLAILDKSEKIFQVFKDGVLHSTLTAAHAPDHLIAVGPHGVVYGTNWEEGGYHYYLETYNGRHVRLTHHDETYFCVMMSEGVIMPSRERVCGSELSLMVCK